MVTFRVRQRPLIVGFHLRQCGHSRAGRARQQDGRRGVVEPGTLEFAREARFFVELPRS